MISPCVFKDNFCVWSWDLRIIFFNYITQIMHFFLKVLSYKGEYYMMAYKWKHINLNYRDKWTHHVEKCHFLGNALSR
jgi:hypothetical protein